MPARCCSRSGRTSLAATGSAAALGTNLLGVIGRCSAGSVLLLPALVLLPDVPSRAAAPSSAPDDDQRRGPCECWLVVRWLGGRLERLEFTDELSAGE
jgi:hypothetical protein